MQLKTLTLLLLINLMPFYSGTAQVKILSKNAKISLLTCGPGEAVWSKFGHSALWVYDTQTGIDRVYNYGTFEFTSNDFYFQFVKGTANYRLSVTNYLNFYNEYKNENRSVLMQELNLTDIEKQGLLEILEENYKPENRYYRYDFLFQNCSSIIRDVVWKATDGRFSIPDESETKYSYRSMMIPYLSPSPWLKNGEFILLGFKTDHDANPWDQMYLPDFMFNWFENARDENNQSLVSNTHSLFLPATDTDKPSPLTHPNVVLPLVLLIIIVLSIIEIRRQKKFRIIDTVIFLMVGILGIMMIYTWSSSLHIVLHQNMNLVWAFPIHFILAFLVWSKKSQHLIKAYARIMTPLTLLFVCFFWVLPQTIPSVAVYAGFLILIRLIRLAEYPFIELKIRK